MPLREIKSVPHTWGHVIGFENALEDGDHAGHEDAIGQWRGLLTMLALRNYYSDLLNDADEDSGSGVEGEPIAPLVKIKSISLHGGNTPFVNVADEEKLSETGDLSWETVHLLYTRVTEDRQRENKDVLVGMLSPKTIAVPARGYRGDEHLKHSWVRQGLCDPLRDKDPKGDPMEKLTPDQLQVCLLFVCNLIAGAKDGAEDGGELDDEASDVRSDSQDSKKFFLADHIIKLLEQFRDGLEEMGKQYSGVEETPKRDYGKDVPKVPGALGNWQRDERELVPDGKDLYRELATTWKDKSWEEDTVSDLTIGKIKTEKRSICVVLADPRCKNTLNREAHLISVVNGISLADLAKLERDLPRLRKKAARKNVILLQPEDLLSAHLTSLEDFKADIGTHPNGFQTKLLPITPVTLLLQKDIGTLKKKLKIIGGSTTKAEVSLELTLTRRDGKSTPHRVRRKFGKYTRGKAPIGAGYLHKAYPPSALASWPNFQRDDWEWNFLYACGPSDHEGRSVVPTTGVSKECLKCDLASEGRAGWATGDVVAQWASPEGPWDGTNGSREENDASPWVEWLRIQDQTEERLLMRAKWPFDAVLFRLPGEYETVYAGLGILPIVDHVGSELQNEATIACDFGTSNTIVYTDVGKGAKAAVFEPRLRRFNSMRKRNGDLVDKSDLYAFMPVNDVNQPFATVMQRRGGLTSVNDEAWLDQPLWRDYAFFDPHVRSLTEKLLGPGNARLIFDLKWGSKEHEGRRMARYLRHITILSLADIIADAEGMAPEKVTWHFSYPMSMEKKRGYRKRIGQHCVGKGEGVRWHTESDAALAFFEDLPPVVDTNVVLDIGGGSTDIAIGTRPKGAVWQHSIRLAGDELMTEFLLYNRSLLSKLKVDRIGGGNCVFGDEHSRNEFMRELGSGAPIGEADRNAARAIINSKGFGDAFNDSFEFIEDSEEMTRLRIGASLMMGGLCLFVGKQIRALVEAKVLRTRPDLDNVRLCFGGRGSTLLRQWQGDPSFRKLTSFLEREIDSAKGKTRDAGEDIEVRFSDEMKHEAARGMLRRASSGMLVDKNGNLTDRNEKIVSEDDEADPYVAGIGAQLGDLFVQGTDFMDASGVRVREDVTPNVIGDEFWRFIDRVEEQCKVRIRVRDNRVAEGAILRAGAESFGSLVTDEKKESAAKEAPFIAMLKELMRLVYSRNVVAERKK